MSPVAYQLGLPPTWTVHDIFHASLLTRYRETAEHGVNFHQPPPGDGRRRRGVRKSRLSWGIDFGQRHKLQYLIKWKGYSTADDTWEAAEQIFAPQLIEAYHQKHPKSQPFLHKGGSAARGRVIHFPRSCLTTLIMHSTSCRRPPTSNSPFQFHPCKSALLWTRTTSTESPRRPQARPPHWSTLSPRDESPPSLPSPSSKPSGREGVPKPSRKSPRSPPAPSSDALRPMRLRSGTCVRTSRFCVPKSPRPLLPLGTRPQAQWVHPQQWVPHPLLHPPLGGMNECAVHPQVPRRPHHGRGNHGRDRRQSLRLPPRGPPPVRRLRGRRRELRWRAPPRVALGPPAGVTGRDTDSVPGSDSRPLARQGTVAAALRLMRDESCGREEWIGERKADSI